MISFLHRIYIFFITPLRSNGTINFLLFGFYPNNKKFGSFWDWTSIELKKIIRKHFNSNMSFLDVGTGPYGLLSLYVQKRLNANSIFGSDYCEDIVNNAMEESNSKNILFFKSDLFENIKGQFDCIVFNAPYIEKDFGVKIGVLKDTLSEKRWSGGVKGTSTIERFIKDLHIYLTANGFCLLGVNHFYVKNELILNVINENTNLQIVDYSKNRITKSGVYIIKKK